MFAKIWWKGGGGVDGGGVGTKVINSYEKGSLQWSNI